MKLKTYIVNLEKSVVRKQYMQGLLHRYDILDIEFIKAIDGRLMSDTQRKTLFDYDASMKHYGRNVLSGLRAHGGIRGGGRPNQRNLARL